MKTQTVTYLQRHYMYVCMYNYVDTYYSTISIPHKSTAYTKLNNVKVTKNKKVDRYANSAQITRRVNTGELLQTRTAQVPTHS